MIDEETYKKEIVRMWDTIRCDEDKGKGSCSGVYCGDCQLSSQDDFANDTCTNNINAFKVIKIVEKWSKEHHQKKLTRLEFEILKLLENEGYKYIVRSQINNIIAYESMPQKLSNCWEIQSRYKIFSLFNGLFQFIKWEDEDPTSIKEVLENCEVEEK